MTGSITVMDSHDTMSVVLTNKNSTLTTSRFEIYDNVCNGPVGIFTLRGGESRTVIICRDDNGKGSVKIRVLDPSPTDWVEIGSIIHGDVVSI